MHVLKSFGWLWRSNGVELAVCLDGGQCLRVFVPLSRVKAIFDSELAAEGMRPSPSVGAPTVGSLFGNVTAAISRMGHRANFAVNRGASRLTRVASRFGAEAWRHAHGAPSGLMGAPASYQSPAVLAYPRTQLRPMSFAGHHPRARQNGLFSMAQAAALHRRF